MVKEYELSSILEKSPYIFKKNRDGTIVPSFRELGVASLEDDDVIAFIENGRRMFIEYDKDGAYKYEV